MNVYSLIEQTHKKQKANALTVLALLLLTCLTAIFFLVLCASLFSKIASIFVAVAGLLALAYHLKNHWYPTWPSKASAALAFDSYADTKERVVSLLELEDLPDSDQRKQLLVKQLEQQIKDVSLDEAFPLETPKFLKRALFTLPLFWFLIGWYLAPAVLYPIYTNPIALELNELLEDEEDLLPEPVKESLTELAEAIEANELNSEEVVAAIAQAESEVDAALTSLALEASDEERTIEAEGSLESSGNEELREQNQQSSPIQPDNTPKPTPTPEKDTQPEQKEQQTPTPEPEKKQEKKQEQDEKSDSESKKDEQSEAGDDQEGDGEGDGAGSKNSSGQQSGDGEGEQEDSGSGDQSTESSSKKGQSKESGKGGEQQKQGQESQEQNQQSESGSQSAQTQEGQQESKSGGKESQKQDSQSSSESGQQQAGKSGKAGESSKSAPEQSLSKVKEKLEELKEDSNQGGGKEQKQDTQAEKELEDTKKENKDNQAEDSEDENDPNEGKKSGDGNEKSVGDDANQQTPKKEENSATPPDFSDAAEGVSGASTRADNAKEKKERGEGEAFGDTGPVGFNEVTIPATDEKFDTRFTGKDTQRTAGSGGNKYRVDLEEIELSKPEAQPGATQQRIPLEYRSILEGE